MGLAGRRLESHRRATQRRPSLAAGASEAGHMYPSELGDASWCFASQRHHSTVGLSNLVSLGHTTHSSPLCLAYRVLISLRVRSLHACPSTMGLCYCWGRPYRSGVWVLLNVILYRCGPVAEVPECFSYWDWQGSLHRRLGCAGIACQHRLLACSRFHGVQCCRTRAQDKFTFQRDASATQAFCGVCA